MSASSSEEDINRFTESYVRNFPVVQELKEKGSPLRSFKKEKRGKEVPKNYYEQSYLREFPQKGKPQSTGKEVAQKGLKKGGGQEHFGQRQGKYEYSKNYVFRHSAKSDDTSSSASSNSSTSSESFKFKATKAQSQPLKGEPENVYEYYQRIVRENNDDKEDPCQCSECQGRSESSNESGSSSSTKSGSSSSTKSSGSPRERSSSSTESSGSPRERSSSSSEKSKEFEEQKKEKINFTQELIQAVAQRLEVRYSKADELIDSNPLSQKIKLSAEQHVQNIEKSKMDTESQNFSFFNIKNLTADYLVKAIDKPSHGLLILSYQEAISQLLQKPKVVNKDLPSTVAKSKVVNKDLTSTVAKFKVVNKDLTSKVAKPKVVNPDLTSTAAKTKSLRDQQLQLIQQVRPATSRKIQPSQVDKPKKKSGKKHLMSSSSESSKSSSSESDTEKSASKEKTYYQPRQFTWMLPQGQPVVVQKGLKETTKVAKLVEKDKEDSEKSLEDSDSFHKTVDNLLDFSKKSLKKVPTIPKKYRR